MQDKLLSIQEAGKLLGVSAKTLRRWEARGILTTQRTVGNQRRYLKSQIENFKTYRDLGIQDQFSPNQRSLQGDPLQSHPPGESSPHMEGGKGVREQADWEEKAKKASLVAKKAGALVKKGVILGTFASLILVGTLTVGIGLIKGVDYINYLKEPKLSNVPQFSQSVLNQEKQVLAAETGGLNPTLLINIPSEFQEDAAFLGQIQAVGGIVTGGADIDAGEGSVFASNLLYGVASGSGILIGTGQTPTITNIGVLTLNGSTADLTLKGSGATSISTSGSTITISSTTSDGDITGVTAGNGLSGGGSSGSVSLAVSLSSSGTTTTTSAASGLEFSSGLSLLRGCSNAQTLTWTAATSTWGCATSGGDFTLSGDSGSDQTISANNTLKVAGGTNGIDTVASATDTVTLNLDTTEIGTTTFGSSSSLIWTFDAGAVDPQIDFNSGSLILNEAGSDIDFRVEADNNANLFTLDAGLFSGVGQISIGSAAQSTATAFTVIDNPAITATSNQNFYKTFIDNSSAVTITGSTTSSIVASLAIDEPNITATGTVTNASTLYISDAPTEGASGNFALWVDNGSSRFENTPVAGSTTGSALTVVPTYVVEATDLTLAGVRIALDTNSNTDAGDIAYGLNIDDITTTSGPTEYGLRIGSGYDYQMYFELGTRDLRISASAPTAGTSPLTATIPAVGANDTFCLATLANCTGAGGGTGVTFTSQTTNALTKFTSTSGQITSSGVTDDGTTVTIAANESLTLAAGTGSITQTYNPVGTTGTARAHSITSTFGIDVTDQTLSGIFVDANTNGNTDAGDVLNGILINTITASSATEYGLQIGSGYDQNLYLNDTSTNVLLLDGGTITISDGTNTLCSIVDGGTAGNLSCTGTISAGTGADNFWNQATGALFPNNSTVDLLVGAQASSSAKFAVLNINSGTPTASVSAGAAGGAYLNATGTLSTTTMQSLTLGGSTTGNIVIDSGSSSITLSDATTASSSLTVTGTTTTNGTLTANGVVTLGDNGDTVEINSSDWDISTTGAMTGIGAITADGSFTFSNVATDITTGTNEDLTLTPNGTGDTIITSDFDSGVSIGTSSNTPAPLSISGGIGSNAGLIVNRVGTTDDIFTASAAGTTRFTIANSGNITAGGTISGLTGITSSGTITFSGLTSCDTIKTSAGGVLACGNTVATYNQFTASGTYTKPAGTVVVITEVIGAGGGGGGGRGDTGATARYGGGGGGGGARFTVSINGSAVGSTETVTVGSGGSGGSGGVNGAGSNGTGGGKSSFGTHAEAYGGGGGSANGGQGGGGGGGIIASGSQNTAGGAGGNPGGSSAGVSNDAFGGAGGSLNADGGSGTYGGGGGGGGDALAGASGGSSVFGCPAGGSAGGLNTSDIESAGGAGGTTQSYSAGGGGSGGATNGGSGTAGTSSSVRCGTGGGGGGSQDSGTGGTGGAGGAPGGGGGGGGGGTTTGGAAGAGGRGEVRVWSLSSGSGADIAETYFSTDINVEAGDLVGADPNLPRVGFKRSEKPYDQSLLGVISTGPGLVLSDNELPVSELPTKTIDIALAGRVPAKVSTENGPIKIGSRITASSARGVGMRAIRAGAVVGTALENFDCPQTERTEDRICEGKILVFINPSWYDPDVYLTHTGDIVIQAERPKHTDKETVPGSDPLFSQVGYKISKKELDGSETVVDRIGVFAQLLAAKITAGLFEGKNIQTDNLSATTSAFLSSDIDSLIANKIRVESIELAKSTAEVINVGDELASISAKMEILEQLGLFNAPSASNSGELTIVDNLMVSGATTLADAAILNNLTIANNLTISGNSIDTLGTDLEIQPLGQGGVKFLGGAVSIEADGKLKVQENAEFDKNVRVGGVLSAKDVAVSRARVEILSETEVVASGSSGLVTLQANEPELKINNTSAKESSLIFITPKTELDVPLYIKGQLEGSFIVGIKQRQLSDIQFNFLIVN